MKKKRYQQPSAINGPLSLTFSSFLQITRSRWFFVFITTFCIFSYFLLDKPIALYVKHLDLRLIHIAEFITQFGKGTFYYIAFFLLFIFFKFIAKSRKWANASVFLFIAISIPGLLCNLFKMVLGRARPSLLYSEQLYGFTFFKTDATYLSFPSGHSVLITSLMIGFCFVFRRYWLTFVLIALTVSASRVVIGAHYLSDTVAGMYLAILLVPIIYDYTTMIQYVAHFAASIRQNSSIHKIKGNKK